MEHKTALVLSGGGGRGAYHIGVYRALVDAGWVEDGRGPDIIVGTSIGALNGAAIASGRTVAQLEALWRAMRTENVQTLSPEVPTLLRPVLKYVFRDVLTSEALDEGDAGDTRGGRRRSTGPGGWIGGGPFGQLFPPFLHIFDTTPWRHTLVEPQPTALGPLHWVDWERINSDAAPALTITATDVSSGALRTFSNRAPSRQPGPITIDHLMASASIPLIYPWTDIEQRQYWDGAVLANTPLEPVIELAGEAEVDTVVVMMSPWFGPDGAAEAAGLNVPLPDNLFQALARTLDWALAASYHTALELLDERNQLAQAVAQLVAAGLPWDGLRPRPFRRPLIVAPEQLMPPDWIIDYEPATHEHLFKLGYADAERALAQRAASIQERDAQIERLSA